MHRTSLEWIWPFVCGMCRTEIHAGGQKCGQVVGNTTVQSVPGYQAGGCRVETSWDGIERVTISYVKLWECHYTRQDKDFFKKLHLCIFITKPISIPFLYNQNQIHTFEKF